MHLKIKTHAGPLANPDKCGKLHLKQLEDLLLRILRTQLQLHFQCSLCNTLIRHFILMTSCRTETEAVSWMEKAGPLDCCCSHQSVVSPSLCLCQGSQWTFWAHFVV